ncbi:sensor domain-containing diguanylate cyclase [Hydrogenovibrio kuenenii]|uniref:sensor domain-containing diguanylate cyclase n=1 Tax=Hydrogenovibrio kuenenii TaxID=63658 RepID=UPI0004B70943|nr:diguanylate cyclase [Hydrogenovibrio kuenenii]
MVTKVPETDTMMGFLESLPAVLYEYVLYDDGSSEFLYVSPQSHDILGYPQEHFLLDMNNFWNLVHPGDLQRLKDEDVSTHERNDNFFIADVRIDHPLKGEVWIRISSKSTDRQKNSAFIWCGYMIDITDRKKQEADLERLNKKLAVLSNVDGLTGSLNRRTFDDVVKKEWKRALRDGSELSLIIVDIDYFKAYNDNYGHLAGDDCLKLVANTLSKTVKRAADTFARYGGEEFVILLPNTSLVDAIKLAEKCRESILNLNMPHEHSEVHSMLTISLGVSTILPDSDFDIRTFIEAADTCLYQAKANGRNQVVSINKL